MGFWSAFRQMFAPRQDRPELHIAVLSPRSSSTMEKIINTTLQYLKANTTRHVVATQFNAVCDHAQFPLFLREAQVAGFDLVLAISGAAAHQAKQLYEEYGIFIPTLVLTHPETLPEPLPNHMSALLLANDGPFIFRLLTASFSKLRRLLICSNRHNALEVTSLKDLCLQHNIEVVSIQLPRTSQELTEALHTHTAIADALFLPLNSEALGVTPDVIEIAHQHNCPVVASELHAIHYGADIAFGYPVDGLAHECAQRLLHLLQYPKRTIRFVQTVREVHCRSSQQQSVLRSIAAEHADYNFKIIGCTSNEGSEQDRG